jgi:hypothetical protein
LEGLLVEPANRLLSDRAIGVIHERETPRTSSFPIDGEYDLRWRADARQMLPQICLRRRVRQIPNEQTD